MTDRWKGLRRVFRLPLGVRGIPEEVDAEVRFHLEERIEELMGQGLSRPAAEAEALARFGNLPAIGAAVQAIARGRTRRQLLGEWLAAVGRDVRFGARSLLRRPAFSSVAVLTLGLGIGANTAIFSAVDRVLLRPLPVPSPERLFVIRQDVPGLKLMGGVLMPTQAEELALDRELFEAFTGVAASSYNLTGSGEPQRITALRTMGDFFGIFALTPAAGRFYPSVGRQLDDPRVVVLNYGFWKAWAGGDPEVIGRSIELNGQPYRIVGVLSAGLRYQPETQVFLPLEITDRMREQGPWMITAIGRLPPSTPPERMASLLQGVTARWQADPRLAMPPEMRFALSGVPLTDLMAGELEPLLRLLMVAVALVLLIACANVANLQLVRSATRARELAVRAALGAGRWPILRQLLVENALLAMTGGAVGLLFGFLAIRTLRSMDAIQFPALKQLELDPLVLGFTAVITGVTVLLFGSAAMWRAARLDLQSGLREGTRGSGGPKRNRLLACSAATQVGLSLMLLLASGLLIRSLALLLATDPGFRSEQVLTFRVTLPAAAYQQEAQYSRFFGDLTGRLAALNAVEAAGAISDLPFGEGRNSSPFSIEGRPVAPGEPARHADMRFVAGDYFKALGIPLKRGRSFGPEDRKGNPWVVVIDESLAKQYFGTADPIGQRLIQGPTSTIIGVVGTIKHGDLTEPDKPTVYYSYHQAPWYRGLYLTLRTGLEPGAAFAEARAKVAELDPRLPVYDFGSMEERVNRSVGARRLAMVVLSGFAGLALLLALLGVYGVLSYGASQRVHELGIRLALGAVPGQLVRMVLGNGLLLAGIGMAAGLAGFFLLARFLSALLYGVGPRDPLTLIAGVAVIGLGAACAALIPARRAARVDVVQALRDE